MERLLEHLDYGVFAGASTLWSDCWSIRTMERLLEHQDYGADAVASRLWRSLLKVEHNYWLDNKEYGENEHIRKY